MSYGDIHINSLWNVLIPVKTRHLSAVPGFSIANNTGKFVTVEKVTRDNNDQLTPTTTDVTLANLSLIWCHVSGEQVTLHNDEGGDMYDKQDSR